MSNEQHRRIREQDAMIVELRALCGEAARWCDELRAPGLSIRLRAASKGKQ